MKKAFLAPLAVLAAALTSGEAVAIPTHTTSTEVSPEAARIPSDKISVTHEGDIFNFVLKRNAETGQMVAEHESHYSHRSHSSHRSHTSGY